jgi:hypothetical protein
MLLLFKKSYGHTKVPKSFKGRVLRQWVDKQQHAFKAFLKPDHQKPLDEIGFMWNLWPNSRATIGRNRLGTKHSDESDEDVLSESDSCCILGTKVHKVYHVDGSDGTRHIAWFDKTVIKKAQKNGHWIVHFDDESEALVSKEESQELAQEYDTYYVNTKKIGQDRDGNVIAPHVENGCSDLMYKLVPRFKKNMMLIGLMVKSKLRAPQRMGCGYFSTLMMIKKSFLGKIWSTGHWNIKHIMQRASSSSSSSRK